ncbi:MAG: hypothetical protein DMF67_14555 [Acidobacteria bacterium]|nr:MAG: hypothetical protein DMF66_02110 [Acidobacteriota bacterium]PYS82035.1 MAG: hypothetical protein DMF67_14555 [Acidobacteriota bacterium]
MHEGVHRKTSAVLPRKAFVLLRQTVAEFFERASQVRRVVRRVNAVVQMNLHLAEALRLQPRHPFQNARVILFGWIKIRVAKRRAVVVAHGLADGACLLTPTVEP